MESKFHVHGDRKTFSDRILYATGAESKQFFVFRNKQWLSGFETSKAFDKMVDGRLYSSVVISNSQNISKVEQCYFVCICVFIFILNAISPYTTGLRALFNPSDCTGTVPTHK